MTAATTSAGWGRPLWICAMWRRARLDAYVENSLKPWDYAAGLLIVQEAGGAVVTVDGAAPSLKMGGDVMGTNGAVTEELLAVLRQAANG